MVTLRRNDLVVEVDLTAGRSEEHTSELQSLRHLVCRLLLEKNNVENGTPGQAHRIGRGDEGMEGQQRCGQRAEQSSFFFRGHGAPRVLPFSPPRRFSV